MELTKQVCSLELANRLKELGVKQESLYYWIQTYSGSNEWVIFTGKASPGIGNYAAFTVAELILMLQDVAKEDIIVALHDKEVANTLAQLLCTKLQSSRETAGSGLMP